MKSFILIASFFALSCEFRQTPIVPPEDVGGTCTTARETLERHGGCGVDLTTFDADCEEKVRLYAEIGDRYPVGCLTASSSCEEARACR